MWDRIQHCPLFAVRDLHQNQSCHRYKSDFPEALVSNSSLCGIGLIADGKSGCFTVFGFEDDTCYVC